MLPGILACKQRQRPHWSADGEPALIKVEDKSYLRRTLSVRGLISSNFFIRDKHTTTTTTTSRIPTPRIVKTWEFATQISTMFTTPSPPKHIEFMKHPVIKPGDSIILNKLVGKGKDPLDIQMFTIRDPINVALDKVSLKKNYTWNAENEYWWNVVNSHNASDLRDPIKDVLQKIEIDRKNMPTYIPVGGDSDQVIEKEQISAADHRDIIEAALEEIEVDRNNVAKYIPVGANSEQVIEKEHNSAQTYWFDY